MATRGARSCVSCRRKGAKGELVKLANTPDGVVIDYTEKLPGRGAYVCLDEACIGKALKGGALARAFRQGVRLPGTDEFMEALAARIKARVDSLFGMTRKSGMAVMGFEAAAKALRKDQNGLLIIAGDTARNTVEKIMEAGGGRVKAARYSTKDGLGMVLGVSPVGVVYLPGSRLAEALETEIGRLNKIGRG